MVMDYEKDDDKVQDLGVNPKKKKRGLKLEGNGKTIGICVLASLVISIVISLFVVNALGASKSSINNANAKIDGLQYNVSVVASNFQNYATIASLSSYAKTVDMNIAISSSSSNLSSKITALSTQVNGVSSRVDGIDAVLNESVHTVTIVSGYCTVNVSGGVADNLSFGEIKEYDFLNNTSFINISTTSSKWVSWSINGIENDNASVSILVDQDVYIVASGLSNTIDTYTLTYTASLGGRIVPSAYNTQIVNAGGNGSEVIAVSNNSDYLFWGWSDGVLSAFRTDTDVTSNITVHANFINISQ
jgi:hypothetical protein